MDREVVRIRYSAARADRSTAAYPVVPGPVFDEFVHGPEYLIYRPAGIPEWVLLNTLDGEGVFRSATGTRVAAPPGSVTVVPAGSSHEFWPRPGGSWRFQFAQFRPRPDWLSLLSWPEPVAGVLQLRLDRDAQARIECCLGDAIAGMRTVDKHRNLLAMNRLEQALLWCDAHNPAAPRIDVRIQRALQLIEDDIAGPLDVHRLARECALSPSRFAHLFREQLETTPQRYIERRRMELAATLLYMTTLSIGEIAARVGYPNALYFSTRFRRALGTSPTAHRRHDR